MSIRRHQKECGGVVWGTTGVESVKVDQSVCKYVHYGLDGRMVQRNHKRVTAQTGMTSVGVVMWYNGWVYWRRQGMTEWIVSK